MTQETFKRLFDGRAFDESKIEGFDELSPVAMTPRRRAYENLAGLEHNALSETTSPSPESSAVEGEERARTADVAARQYGKLRAKLVGTGRF